MMSRVEEGRGSLKAIKKDTRIACQVSKDDIAEELSLAENQHGPMHPADEYEAFAALHHEHGMSAEDIAARFGVTPSVVKQRLKLGAVSPALLNLYREGEMTLDQLTAFTITDDHARQEQVWNDLGYDPKRQHRRCIGCDKNLLPFPGPWFAFGWLVRHPCK
jgi:ParB family chromosome partitioning protein